MNALNAIAEALMQYHGIYDSPAPYRGEAHVILTALGVDDGPVAITAPDEPVRRLVPDPWGYGILVLGSEVES